MKRTGPSICQYILVQYLQAVPAIRIIDFEQEGGFIAFFLTEILQSTGLFKSNVGFWEFFAPCPLGVF